MSARTHKSASIMKNRSSSSMHFEDVDFAENLRVQNLMQCNQAEAVKNNVERQPGPAASLGLRNWYKSVAATEQSKYDRLYEEYGLRTELITVANEYNSNKKLKKESGALLPWLAEDTPRYMISDQLYVNVRALGVVKPNQILDEKKSSIIKTGLKLGENIRAIGASMV